MMRLNGENAKVLRSSMCDTLRRHFAGDLSLLAEIEANSVSNAPLAQLARDSLCSDPVLTAVVEEDPLTKKRRLERAEEMAELDVVERRHRFKVADFDLSDRMQIAEFARLSHEQKMGFDAVDHMQKIKFAVESFNVDTCIKSIESFKSINTAGLPVDVECLKALTHSLVKATVSTIGLSLDPDTVVDESVEVAQPAAAIAPPPAVVVHPAAAIAAPPAVVVQPAAAIAQPSAPIAPPPIAPSAPSVLDSSFMTVAQIARAYGYNFDKDDCISLGGLVADAFKRKYGKKPHKISGSPHARSVYTTCDYPLVLDAIHALQNGRT